MLLGNLLLICFFCCRKKTGTSSIMRVPVLVVKRTDDNARMRTVACCMNKLTLPHVNAHMVYCSIRRAEEHKVSWLTDSRANSLHFSRIEYCRCRTRQLYTTGVANHGKYKAAAVEAVGAACAVCVRGATEFQAVCYELLARFGHFFCKKRGN